MRFEHIRRSGYMRAVRVAALACVSSLACDEQVPDAARLATLSEVELVTLCDDVTDALEPAWRLSECGGGWTASIVPQHDAYCRDLDLQGCGATAGDVRACARVVSEDPCAAASQSIEACEPLYASACEPAFLATLVFSSCPLVTEAELEPFAGIYEITRHTKNSVSCDVEGEPVTPDEVLRWFVFVRTNGITFSRGALESCLGLEHCRATAERLRALTAPPETPADGGLSRLFECSQQSANGFTGTIETAVTGWAGSRCHSLSSVMTATAMPGGVLRLEERTFDWRTAENPEGCTSVDGELRASGLPCNGREVYEARRLETL